MRFQAFTSAAGRLAALVFCALALAACGETPKDKPAAEAEAEARLLLARVGFADLPGWRDDRVAEALPALVSV